MNTYIRPYRSGGWFSQAGSIAKSQAFSQRLGKRIEGESGVVVTLTLDSTRSSEDAYEELSRNKAVSRFLETVEDRTGNDFSGKWICKLEFTDRGMPHFHLIILGIQYIPHSILEEAWARGYVWITKFSKTDSAGVASYIAKKVSGYLSKNIEPPDWVYIRPRGSVKIIRTSPGFWNNDPAPLEYVPPDSEQPRKGLKLPCYVTIGDALNQSDYRVEISEPSSGRVVTFDGVSIGEIALNLARQTHDLDTCPGGISTSVTFEQTLETAASAASRSRPLHLKRVLNRAWVMNYLSEKHSLTRIRST